MRTLELHASPKQVQRTDGRGAVRSAAYRAAARLYDERTGQWHDYTKKQGVEFARIYTPDHAPDWARERSTLWNAAEAKENRKNSMTAREWIVAFPYEFNAMQRREAGENIVREIMRRTGAAVDICYHQPDKDGDQRNFHAHILYTTRGFDPESKDGWAKNKYRNFSHDKIDVDGEKVSRASAEVNHMRAFMAGEMNRIAARDRIEVHTEHLSFEARGVEREPTQKMGPMATDMERKGQRSERGDVNREILELNAARAEVKKLQDEKKIIDLAIEREKRRIAEEAKPKRQAAAKLVQKKTEGWKRQQREQVLQDQQDRQKQQAQQREHDLLRALEDAKARQAAADTFLNRWVFRGRLKTAAAEVKKAERKYSGFKQRTHTHDQDAAEFQGRETGQSPAPRRAANQNPQPPPVAKQFSENGGVSEPAKIPEQRPASFADWSQDYKPEPEQGERLDQSEEQGQKIDGPKQRL